MKKLLVLMLTVVMILSFGIIASATEAENATSTIVTTEAELSNALANGGNITLGADIQLTDGWTVETGKEVVLDLAGNDLTVGQSTSNASIYGKLTVKDTVGGGVSTARNHFVYGELILESGTLQNISTNSAGFALNIETSGKAIINGGSVDAVNTANYAIRVVGNLIVNGGNHSGKHGVITVYGGTAVINNGTFTCVGVANQTDNVVNVSSGSITINNGTFIADSDIASGGACVHDPAGTAVIENGTFSNSSGGDVWGKTGGTVINGGTFENLAETQHVTTGAVITNKGETIVKNEDGTTATVVATVNGTGYATFDEAITAANALTGEVVIRIYGKVEYTDTTANLTGAYDKITFIGMTEDAEISLVRANGLYISGTSTQNVAFEDLILSRPNGTYETDTAHMGYFFTVYRVATLTYTNCQFPDGACAQNCTATYDSCTFYNNTNGGKYSLWVYAGLDCTVNNCTFASDRGIKMYAEGAAKNTNLTITNTSFANCTAKPAIVLGYGKSVTLSGNTYSSKGVFELDASTDCDPNGTTIIADITDIACMNDNYADCGVIVDGKIYVTLTDAVNANAITGESTVTLMYSTTEAVELPAGTTLNTNGYTAENVTVKAPETALKGTFNGGHMNIDDPEEIYITSEIIDLYATKSVVIKFYTEDGELVATTTLLKSEYFISDTVTVKACLSGSSSSWKTEWENGGPRANKAPAYGVLYVDDTEMNTAEIKMRDIKDNEIKWTDIGAVLPALVNTYEELVEALGNGYDVILGEDIICPDKATLIVKDQTLDLGTHTLTINGESGRVENATIQNGTVKITTYEGDTVADGLFDVYGTVSYVKNVDFYSDKFAILSIFDLKTGNLEMTDCTIEMSNNTVGGDGGLFSTNGGDTLIMTNCNVIGTDVGDFIVNGTAILNSCDVTLKGTVKDGLDNGFNGAALTLNNTSVEIDGATGRGITTDGDDIVIKGESNVVLTNCAEGGIRYKASATITVDSTSKLSGTLKVDAAAASAKINETTLDQTGEELPVASVENGVVTVKAPEVDPKGDIQVGYISGSGIYNGISAFYGDAINVVAKDSFVVKLYYGDVLVGTATLNDPDKVLLNGKEQTISWHAALTNDGDDWWVTEWVGGALKLDSIPNRVVLCVDGTDVSEGEVQMYKADQSEPVFGAKVDENGVILGFVAGAGFLNGANENAPKYTDAFATAINQDGTLVLLRDITLTAKVTVTTNAALDLNGKTITTSGIVSSRVIVLENGCTEFVLNANGGAIVSADALAYGIIDVNTSANVTVNGGTYDFDTNNGGIFKFRAYKSKITLNNITVYTNSQISGPNYADNELVVNGGTFKAENVYNATNIFAFYVESAKATFTDMTMENMYIGGIEAHGSTVIVENCNISVLGTNSAPFLSAALAVSSGGNLTINGGSYSTKPNAATDANGQGTTHGSWTVCLMSSGGTITVNGGTFSNGYYDDGTGATPSNPRELFTIGADNDYGDVINSHLIINGGTFNSIGSFVHCETIWDNDGDGETMIATMAVTITDGDFTGCAKVIGGCDPISTGNKVNVTISGGTYSENNAIADSYLAENYKVIGNTDGTYTVKKVYIEVTYADGTVEYFDDILEAVPYTTNYPKLEGAYIKLLADYTGSGIRLMENGMVFDLNGFTYTISAGTGSQGTTTQGFQIRPEVTESVTIKGGNIAVAPDAKIAWMFNSYASNLVIENVTVDCTNMAYDAYGSSVYVLVVQAGDDKVDLKSTTISGFDSSKAGNAVVSSGSISLDENTTIGGAIMLDPGATLTAKEGIEVVTADGYKLQYVNGTYTSVEVSYVAQIGENKYESIADALEAAKEAGITNLVITIIGENTKDTKDTFDLIYTEAFENVTIKQDNGGKVFYIDTIYTGTRTISDGKFVFDGVNITIVSQIWFECEVVLTNNSTVTRSDDVKNFVYYGKVTIEPGSKFLSVIDDIFAGEVTVDGGKTDGSYNESPDFKTVFFDVRSGTLFTIKNGAYVLISSGEGGKLTLNGNTVVDSSKLVIYSDIIIGENASFTIDTESLATVKKVTGSGVITIDATGITAESVLLISGDMSGFTGIIELIGENVTYEITEQGLVVNKAKKVELEDIFTYLGVSSKMDGTAITVGFAFDKEAYAQYCEENGALDFGTHFAVSGYTAIEQSLVDYANNAGQFNVIVKNITDAHASYMLEMALYVGAGDNKQYVTANGIESTISVTYIAIPSEYSKEEEVNA